MAYSNVTDLVSRARSLAKRIAEDQDEARNIYLEYIRDGAGARTDPYFFKLDEVTGLPTTEARVDLPFSYNEFASSWSAFLVLSGGTDDGLTGLAAKIDAARAALDKIRN